MFKGGAWELLGIQTLAAATLSTWAAVTSFTLLGAIHLTGNLRMRLPPYEVNENGLIGGAGSTVSNDRSQATSSIEFDELQTQMGASQSENTTTPVLNTQIPGSTGRLSMYPADQTGFLGKLPAYFKRIFGREPEGGLRRQRRMGQQRDQQLTCASCEDVFYISMLEKAGDLCSR